MAERDDGSQNKLFRTEVVPGTAGSGRLFDEQAMTPEPVECLGMTFASGAARRAYFMERLRELLPELRKRPDFPAGDDDAILRLSDPPWYTACPNPFLADFAAHYGRPYDAEEPYHREPFAVDVSEGKTDPLYRAHGYHTKVPHRAIVPSILHYTRPGDLVLDGFCGSGMTGVAAQWCGTAPAEYRREDRAAVAGGRPPGAGVGCAPRAPGRPVAGGDLHRRQLQHAVRRRRLCQGGAAASGRGGSRDRLDVRDAAYRRQDEGPDQLHGMERSVLVPGMRRRSGVPRRRAWTRQPSVD